MKTEFLPFFFCICRYIRCGAGSIAHGHARCAEHDLRSLSDYGKKALERVFGVLQVKVDYAGKTAEVEYDDSAATADQLNDATKNAGYPS